MIDITKEFITYSAAENKAKVIIKKFEGLRLQAYICPSNIITIGYGSTYDYSKNRKIQIGDKITLKEAEYLLLDEIIKVRRKITDLVKVPLNDNQLAALISFCFNVGTGAFSKSRMLKLINTNNYSEAANEFSRWIYGKGSKKLVLRGLVTRREAEKQLFIQNESEIGQN